MLQTGWQTRDKTATGDENLPATRVQTSARLTCTNLLAAYNETAAGIT